ncbi:MAG TPA: hypothetical protein VE987_20645 [Polyangiaceae bacterium]|nr:hypothetical protein [Polyangiaceae bacterium]
MPALHPVPAPLDQDCIDLAPASFVFLSLPAAEAPACSAANGDSPAAP